MVFDELADIKRFGSSGCFCQPIQPAFQFLIQTKRRHVAPSIFSVSYFSACNTYYQAILQSVENPAPDCTACFGNGRVLSFRCNEHDCITRDWSHRLAWPRTAPSQGADTGSNPVGTTNSRHFLMTTSLLLVSLGMGKTSVDPASSFFTSHRPRVGQHRNREIQ